MAGSRQPDHPGMAALQAMQAENRTLTGPAAESAFWKSTHTLTRVRQHAHALYCPAWPFLAGVLAQVAYHIDPSVVVPEIAGPHASLNPFFGIAVRSGGGKSAPMGASLRFFANRRSELVKIGSGEAIPKVFGRVEKQDGQQIVARIRDAAIVSVPEVDSMMAQASRPGSTLISELREMWGGGALGHTYSDATKSVTIDAHTYRAALILQAQPEKLEPLFRDRFGGTLQRFLWLPGEDPDMRHSEQRPDPLPWSAPAELANLADPLGGYGHRRHEVTYPAEVVAAVQANRWLAATGRADVEPLDGHAMLARLKLAALFAFLHDSAHVQLGHWRMAGVVMGVSAATRNAIIDAIERDKARRHQESGQGDAIRADAKERHKLRLLTISSRAGRILREAGSDGVKRRAFRGRFDARERPIADEWLAEAIAGGIVKEMPADNGPVYFDRLSL